MVNADKQEAYPFRFKQFVVHHDRCAMKVGTDAVLLGAWADVTGVSSVLDIGTGSGIVALMIAQRTPRTVKIAAVELAAPDLIQATENFVQSPWSDRITAYHSAIQEYAPASQFDRLVCNPPYFNSSLLPPAVPRQVARHTGRLSYDDLLGATDRLLKPDGRLAIILPTVEGLHFQMLAERSGLHPVRRLAFYSRKGKPQERWLFEFSREKQPADDQELMLYDKGQEWSSEYRRLTGDFYLSAKFSI